MSVLIPSYVLGPQVPPGATGGAGTPTPPASGLVRWYDGADVTTMFNAVAGGAQVAPGGAVARWVDKGSDGANATQSTLNNRPLYQSSQHNGLPALVFDGANDWLAIPAISRSTFTVFVVGCASGGSYQAFLGGQNNSHFLAVYPPGGGRLLSENTAYYTYTSATASMASYSALCYKDDGTTMSFYQNGSSVAVESGAPGGGAFSLDQIGGYGVTSWLLSGGIGEILVYNSALSDADRAVVNTYLHTKWGT